MKIRNPFIARALVKCCLYLLRLLYSSCRIILYEEEPNSSPYSKPIRSWSYNTDYIAEPAQEKHLYCMWHDILLMSTFCGVSENMAALVSQHRDGGYLSIILEELGIKPIRGSSRRGGSKAVKQCLKAAENYHISITPDGPTGPRHQLKPGIVFLASQSGRKIVPVTSSCKRYWRIRAKWSDMLIPKPFTTVLVITGKHFSIPEKLEREQLQDYVEELEQYMHEFTKKYESFSESLQILEKERDEPTASQQRAA